MSGREAVTALRHFGFDVVSQRGSHMKLERIAPDGVRETLTVPDHRGLDTGNLPRDSSASITVRSQAELLPFFDSKQALLLGPCSFSSSIMERVAIPLTAYRGCGDPLRSN